MKSDIYRFLPRHFLRPAVSQATSFSHPNSNPSSVSPSHLQYGQHLWAFWPYIKKILNDGTVIKAERAKLIFRISKIYLKYCIWLLRRMDNWLFQRYTGCSWNIFFFSLKCDFSELCQFCCSASVWPAIVYTHWGETERGQSPDYISKSSK